MKTNYSNSSDVHNTAKQRQQQGPGSQGWQSSSSFAAGIFSLLVQVTERENSELTLTIKMQKYMELSKPLHPKLKLVTNITASLLKRRLHSPYKK